MTRARAAACVAALCSIAAARGAGAQTSAEAGRFEVSGGASWIGRTSIGASDAGETTSSNGSLRIFSTGSDLAAAPAVDLRVGVRAVRNVTVEAEAAYGRPELRIAVSGDIENGAPTTAVEKIQEYMIGGAVVWRVPKVQRPRLAPFVEAGGGYLRQLHDRALLAQTGRYYAVGGGVVYLLASRAGRVKATGVRVDARAVIRRDGVAFAAGGHTAPSIGASLFFRF